jgi:hypothetical protein
MEAVLQKLSSVFSEAARIEAFEQSHDGASVLIEIHLKSGHRQRRGIGLCRSRSEVENLVGLAKGEQSARKYLQIRT